MDIMDMSNLFTTLVSNVGFPIAAFCMMWRLHVKESANWQQVLEHNTQALERLTQAIAVEMGVDDDK